MSFVPYTFAGDTGSIPLNQLDVNFANVKTSVYTAGYVTANAQANITSVGTLTSVSVSGNIRGNSQISTLGNIVTSGQLNVAGDINAGSNITIAPGGSFTNGNITILGANIVSVGPTLYIDPNGSGGTDGNVVITGNLTVEGTTTTINSNTVTTNDLQINMANNAATATAANNGGIGVGPAGAEYATLLFNNAATSWYSNIPISVVGTVSANGTITGGNLHTSGLISATGSITGANILTGGLISATGNITGANITGANILTGGLISATGNITGANITGANITGANILTGGLISAAGSITGANITGANILTAGGLSVGGTSTLTGIATAPTAANGVSNTQVATTAFVGSAVYNATASLGTMSTQNANAVSVTGGTISGLGTPLAVASGGTGLASAGSSGNVLVSDGSNWKSSSLASSGIKLGLGITGETWNNVTGSRSSGTTYTNSYGYPIAVSAKGTGASSPSIVFVVNGVTVSDFNWQFNGAGAHSGGFTIVPPGSTYSLTFNNSGIDFWVELY